MPPPEPLAADELGSSTAELPPPDSAVPTVPLTDATVPAIGARSSVSASDFCAAARPICAFTSEARAAASAAAVGGACFVATDARAVVSASCAAATDCASRAAVLDALSFALASDWRSAAIFASSAWMALGVVLQRRQRALVGAELAVVLADGVAVCVLGLRERVERRLVGLDGRFVARDRCVYCAIAALLCAVARGTGSSGRRRAGCCRRSAAPGGRTGAARRTAASTGRLASWAWSAVIAACAAASDGYVAWSFVRWYRSTFSWPWSARSAFVGARLTLRTASGPEAASTSRSRATASPA